jgi:hypothetical protein
MDKDARKIIVEMLLETSAQLRDIFSNSGNFPSRQAHIYAAQTALNDAIKKLEWPVVYINAAGNKYILNENGFHCEDGPAIITKDGGKEWWVNGLRHREDGPAILTSWHEKNKYAYVVNEYYLFGEKIYKHNFTPEFVKKEVLKRKMIQTIET